MSGDAFIGVDVGGTKTAIAAIGLPGPRVLHRIEMPTPPRKATGWTFLEDIAGRAQALAGETGARAIGISLCELVGLDGAVRSAHRVLWEGLPVADAFAGRPVVVESDVRAGAVAEARHGAGKGFREILYVNLGTGVSSCWVSAGSPHRGARGNALVLASSPVDTICEHCGKPSSHVLEDLAGSAGLLARYRTAGGSATSARDVFLRAEEGDRRAADVLGRAASAIGVGIGLAVNILDPEALVIGGGLAFAGGAYGAPLDAQIRAHVWAAETRALPILRATLGADSALIGAACFARDLVVEAAKRED